MSALTLADVAAARRVLPRAFGPAPAVRARRAAGWLALAAVIALGLWRMEISPAGVWHGIARLGWLLRLMVPPSPGDALPELGWALAETLAMAFLGTFLAAVAAVPLGFLGARTVVRQRLVHFGLRRAFDGFRGVDSLVWALMFVHALGLGPFAGVLALAAADLGVLAKLFADAIENADPRPVEGVRAAGATAPRMSPGGNTTTPLASRRAPGRCSVTARGERHLS